MPCATLGSSDTTTLAASIPIPPIGAPVDTIATLYGHLGVNVGATELHSDGFYPNLGVDKALQMVVLDRYTLGAPSNMPDNNQSFSNDYAGTKALAAAVQALPDRP